MPLVLRQVSHHFPARPQNATTAANLLVHLSSRSNGLVEVALIPANASFASTTSIVCGASIQQSASVSHLGLGSLWKGFTRWRMCAGLEVASA